MAYPSDVAVHPFRGFIARLIVAGLLLLSSGAPYGHAISAAASPQEGSNSPPSPAPAAVLPSAVESDRLILKDGEPVLLRTTRRLSTAKEKKGNEVEFEVTDPIKIGDLIVIPEHAIAFGKITKAEKKRRRGVPGKLEISIERVRLATGEFAPLRAVQRKSGEGTGWEIASNMIDVTVRTYFLGAPIAPLFLLQHGKELILPEGCRFTAFVHGNVVLDRAAVLKAQSLLPGKRTDIGTVFIYRLPHDRMPALVEPVTCGEVGVGFIGPGQFIRLELPPGQYWLRAGKERYGFGLRAPIGEYLALNVEGGNSYYLRTQIVGSWIKGWPQLMQIENSVGESELRTIDTPAEHRSDNAWIAENISDLQAVPKQKDSQRPERSSPSAPQEVDQPGPGPETLFGR